MKRDVEFAFPDVSSRAALASPVVWACLVAVAGILAAYRTTAESVVGTWVRSETFAHGFVVVPLCLWFAWRKREALAQVAARPWWPGLALVGAAGGLWLLASAADAVGLRQFALAFMLQASIVTVVGLPMARVLAFPLAFFLFAVPAGEFMVPTMVDWTADVTVSALRLSGVPVYRQANEFVLPTGKWSVVDACSGIRYLIASFMVGTMYAAIAYRSALRRTFFVLASILVPIVANWVRAYLIVMIGHLSNNRLAAGVDHIIYGWVFFGLVMLVLLWCGSLWSDAPADSSLHTKSEPRAIPALRAAPGTVLAAGLAAIIVASVWKPLEVLVHDVAPGAPSLGEIVSAEGWKPSAMRMPDWKPHYSGYAADSTQTFSDGARSIRVYVAYYRNQSATRKLISSTNQLVPEVGAWKMTGSWSETVPWGRQSAAADRFRLSGTAGELEGLQLFWVGDRVTGSPYVAKALQAWNRFLGRGDDAALIAIYTPIRSPSDPTRQALLDFARAMSPAIDHMLSAARGTAP